VIYIRDWEAREPRNEVISSETRDRASPVTVADLCRCFRSVDQVLLKLGVGCMGQADVVRADFLWIVDWAYPQDVTITFILYFKGEWRILSGTYFIVWQQILRQMLDWHSFCNWGRTFQINSLMETQVKWKCWIPIEFKIHVSKAALIMTWKWQVASHVSFRSS